MPWKIFLNIIALSGTEVTVTNTILFLDKESVRKAGRSGAAVLTGTFLTSESQITYNNIKFYSCFYFFHPSWLCKLLVLSKLSQGVFNTMLNSLGRGKKSKRKPLLPQCQELTKTYKPWGIPRTYSEAVLQMHDLNKGPMFLSEKSAALVSGIFFKSLGPCQQTNIYWSPEKESHSTQLTRVWLLERGCSMARALPAGPQMYRFV